MSNIDRRTPLKTLVRLVMIRWRVEHGCRDLKTGLGIDQFEGRSFTGWHRHVTLALLAQAVCTLLRSAPKSGCAGLTLYAVLRTLLEVTTGACHVCNRAFNATT